MISPGDELTPDFFQRFRQEMMRRNRLWSAPPLDSLNLPDAMRLKAKLAGVVASQRVLARLHRFQTGAAIGFAPFDFIEVEYDEVRHDFVPKPGGHRTILMHGESTTPFGDTAAFALNAGNAFFDQDGLAPSASVPTTKVNQVVLLYPVLDNHGNPTGVWWFDAYAPNARQVIDTERGQGRDSASVQITGGGQMTGCCPGQLPNTLTLDLAGGTGDFAGANESGIALVFNSTDGQWEDNPPSNNILAPFAFRCCTGSDPAPCNFTPAGSFCFSWLCPNGGSPNAGSILSANCGPPLNVSFDLAGFGLGCNGDITATVHQ